MENMPNSGSNPASNAPNTPPVSPSVNPSVNPAPTYQLPQPPVSSPPPAPVSTPVLSPGPTPALSPVATAFKAAGFFSGKVLVSIIAVVVVGGGLAAGYFLFPEPFYNSVGKYFGLPAPSEEAESETDEDEVNAAAEERDASSSSSDSSVASGGSVAELQSLIPGADANFILRLRFPKDFDSLVKKLQESLPRGDGVERDYAVGDDVAMMTATPLDKTRDAVNNLEDISKLQLEEILVALKLDFNEAKKAGSPEEALKSIPFAFVIKGGPELEALFTKGWEGAKAEDPTITETLKAENKGNGLIVTQSVGALALSGELSENPLLKVVNTGDASAALAIDLKEIVAKALQENPPSEEDLADPMQSKQFELMKKTENLSLFGSSGKDGDKTNFSLTLKLGMADNTSAAELVAMFEPQFNALQMFIPPDFTSFLTAQLTAEENMVAAHIVLKNLEGLSAKLSQSMGKPLEDESPAYLPNLNELEPSILEELTRSDIPGAPIGGIDGMEESGSAVPSGKIRRIKK